MSVRQTFDNIITRVRALPAAARFNDFKANFNTYIEAAAELDRGLPMNSNTYSATLLTEFLAAGAITKLQNKFAPLRAFSLDFRTDPLKALAPAECKFISTGATVQTNATNFETGDSTVSAVKITPNQYTVSFHVTNAELNSGLRMDDLMTVQMGAFGNRIVEVCTAPLTTANLITNPAYTAAAASFDWGDMVSLWAALSSSDIKNAILDAPYIARLNNTPSRFQDSGTGTGERKRFAWDSIEMLTDWSGAGANVHGLVCNPQVLGILAGLPLMPPAAERIIQRSTLTIPGIELAIAQHAWFNTATRTGWVSFDVVLGSALIDETAGILIKSA